MDGVAINYMVFGTNYTEGGKMSQEEKYKLALFAVIRDGMVMPQGVKLGKTMHEINTTAVAVMAKIMESYDFERLKESYDSV